MPRILIIEDDALIARAYTSKYATAGFETMVAPDGEAGLELVGTFKPDLVHLDLGVPKVDGPEIIRRIRAVPTLHDLPIVVLSNTYRNRMVKTAMDAGASQCVSKATCTPRMMLEIVERLLAKREAAMSPPSPPPPTPAEPAEPAEVSGSSPDAAPLETNAPVVTTTPAESSATRETQRHGAFQAQIQGDFLKRLPMLLAAIQHQVEPLLRAETDEERNRCFSELSKAANRLAGHAAIAGHEETAEMASAVVALLRDLLEAPSEASASALRTVVDACDFLADSKDQGTDSGREPSAPPVILVVDDDALSRRAICLALARLNVATISVDTPRVALGLLAENLFGLIILDVQMPEMNGFDLCREVRALHPNETTPVVFVTSQSEWESRETATAVGANDLIAKPFLPMELAVKALSLLRRHAPRTTA